MTVQWLGHSCFRILHDGYAIIIDPYRDGMVPGLRALHAEANAVLCSHQHDDHGYTAAITLMDVDTPSPFTITAVQTAHDDAGGEKRGANLVHVLEAGDIRIAHLGDLGHLLTPGQVAKIGRVDALMVPIGGYYTIDAAAAKAVADMLSPNVIIPMHYRSDTFGFDVLGTLDAFTSQYTNVQYYDTDSIEITKAMPQQVAVLAYL